MTFGYAFPMTPKAMPFGLHNLGKKRAAPKQASAPDSANTGRG